MDVPSFYIVICFLSLGLETVWCPTSLSTSMIVTRATGRRAKCMDLGHIGNIPIILSYVACAASLFLACVANPVCFLCSGMLPVRCMRAHFRRICVMAMECWAVADWPLPPAVCLLASGSMTRKLAMAYLTTSQSLWILHGFVICFFWFW